jgi:transcriptional regulator with XRE-family HTH domain
LTSPTAPPVNPVPVWMRARREELHLSQEALARFLDVSVRTVTRWEAGKSKVGIGTLRAMAGITDEAATTPRELTDLFAGQYR